MTVPPVPEPHIGELVERAMDELDLMTDELTATRNAAAEATHHMIATREILIQLRETTHSAETTWHAEDVSYVTPHGAGFRIARQPGYALIAYPSRRQLAVAAWIVAVVLLVVVVAVVR